MIYLAGIDTLLIGFYLKKFNLTDEDWIDLVNAKERAKAPVFKSSGCLFNFKGLEFVMLPAGKKPYTYTLQNDDFTLKIARKVSNDKFPEVFIEFRSQFLWRLGYIDIYMFIKDWISKWAEIKRDVVSRVDLTVDLSGFPQIKPENIISRARQRKEYLKLIPIEDGAIYSYGSKTTGYSFGSGPLILRIYDKTLEVKKSHKEWFHDLWKRGGWDGTSDIARVEAQLRRAFLKEFKVTSFQSFQDSIGDIFRYITQDWFTLREPTEDKNKSRWPVTAFWSEVQGSLNHFGQIHGEIREKIKLSRLEVLIPQAIGLMTSIGAQIDDFKMEDFNGKANSYLRRKGKSFKSEVEEKRKKRSMFEDGYEPF